MGMVPLLPGPGSRGTLSFVTYGFKGLFFLISFYK